MSNTETLLNDQNSSDYTLVRAELNSSRAIRPIDVVNVVTDFEIYEHITKPYLTGRVVLSDQQRLFDRFDFQGAETFELEVGRVEGGEIKNVVKKFIVDRVEHVVKTNESSAALVLHLIEDIAMSSVLKNVNKCMQGQPHEIISQIANEYLGKEVTSAFEENVANNMKVIVPNLSPVDAMLWILRRALSKEGMPYFLWSSFTTDYLNLYDLGTLMRQNVLNEKFPFTNLPAQGSFDLTNRMFQIKDYKYSGNENLLSMVKQGLIGGNHSYFDVTNGTFEKVQFNIHDDVYPNVYELNKRQQKFTVSPNLAVDDVTISDYVSEYCSYVYASKGFSNTKSYSEENDEASHKKKVMAKTYQELLTKTPIEISVDGREFLIGGENMTCGNQIKVLFKASGDRAADLKIDIKMSGDYLIHACRHVFSKEKYYTQMLLTKMSNYNSDDMPGGA